MRRRTRAKNPDCAITTEGVSEGYIPYLDMFDNRCGNMEYFGSYGPGDPMGGEVIPLFNYVYHDYIGSYQAAYPECNRPEVLYWTRCLGKSLVQGVVPTGGKYLPDPPELNPVTIGFYKKVIRAAGQECWPYLMGGRMLPPPEIDVPMIAASYCKMSADEHSGLSPRLRHTVQDRSVQHSAWRGRDGSIGYIFVNVSEAPVQCEFELSAYDMQAGAYDVDRLLDGAPERLMVAAALPQRVPMEMPPLSVALVRVRPHSLGSEEAPR